MGYKDEVEDLIALQCNIKELINIYNNLESLIYADFLRALNATSRNSRKDTKLKDAGYWFNWIGAGSNWYLMNLGFGVRGGFLVSVLYKRRARNIFKVILSTCALYLIHQTNSENSKIVEGIIHRVRNKQKSLYKIKDESVERIGEIVRQLSVILGIPIIASVVWEWIVPMLGKPQFPNIPEGFISFLFSGVILFVQLVIYWVMPKIRWYRTLMKIYKVKDKERDVYDSLLPIERIVLSR